MPANTLPRRDSAALILAYIARGGTITYCPPRTYSFQARAKLATTRKPSPAQRRAIASHYANLANR